MAPLDKPLNPPRKKKVGFALLDPEVRRELARKGGAAPHKTPRPFANKQLAIEAGRKGGTISKGGGRPPGTYKDAERARNARLGEWKGLRADPMFPKQEE